MSRASVLAAVTDHEAQPGRGHVPDAWSGFLGVESGQRAAVPRVLYRDAVQRVLWITLVLNAAVALAKLFAGLATSSLSLVGDAAHSAVDTANNVVGLVAVAVAAREADASHPYGHHKVETLAAFVLAGLLFVTCFNIAIEAVRRLAGHNTVVPEATPAAFVVVLVTLLVNVGVSRYEARRGRQLRSEFLLADAAHTRSDVLVTLTVLASLILVRVGLPRVDAAISLVIALLIGRIGFEVFQRTVPILVDASALDEKHVVRVAAAVPGVLDAHAVRSRRAGDLVFLDFHILVEPGTDSQSAHDITEAVEEALEGEFGPTSATVHVETSRHCGY
ncbi:MAG: cation diffusion facilitator family transporter [Candidatus Krumholzibacteriia bacterium]